MVNRWESPEYLVYSSIDYRCTGFVVDCPMFSGYSPLKVGKTWIRLAANTLWPNMRNICIQIHVGEVFMVALGATTKCRHFSKLYANNFVWKSGKINEINTGPVVLPVIYFEDQDMMTVTVCNKR